VAASCPGRKRPVCLEAMKRPLVALTGLLLAQVLAQVDLALSPARLELVLPPGGEVTESVRVRNGLDREEALSVALRPFTLTPQGDVAESPERNLCPHLTATPTPKMKKPKTPPPASIDRPHGER
jgi:hypothetical protein